MRFCFHQENIFESLYILKFDETENRVNYLLYAKASKSSKAHREGGLSFLRQYNYFKY